MLISVALMFTSVRQHVACDIFVDVLLRMWVSSGPWSVHTGIWYRPHLKNNVNSQTKKSYLSSESELSTKACGVNVALDNELDYFNQNKSKNRFFCLQIKLTFGVSHFAVSSFQCTFHVWLLDFALGSFKVSTGHNKCMHDSRHIVLLTLLSLSLSLTHTHTHRSIVPSKANEVMTVWAFTVSLSLSVSV